MKKLLVAAVFALVALSITVPGYMGWETEKHMRGLAEYINSLPGYQAKWNAYRRGWFQSEGQMEVRFVEPRLPQGEVTLPVDFTLQHGPILTSGRRWQLGWFEVNVRLTQENEAVLQELLTVEEDGPIYQLSALMALDGITSIVDRWLPAKLHFEDVTLQTNGYSGSGSIGLDRVLNYRATLQPVTINSSSGAVVIGATDIEVVAELAQMTEVYVVPGTMKVSTETVALKTEREGVVGQWALEDARIDFTTLINDGLYLNSASHLRVAKIEAPSVPAISDLTIGFHYQRIPLEFIKAYQDLMNAAPEDAGPEYWQGNLGQLVLTKLLTASPVFEVSPVSFTTDQGQGQMNLKLGVEGGALSNADLSPQNPLAVIPFLDAELGLTLDQPLFDALLTLYAKQELEAQLQDQAIDMSAEEFAQALEAQKITLQEMLRLQGLITIEGGQVLSKLTLSKGQATLNGQPLPLPF